MGKTRLEWAQWMAAKGLTVFICQPGKKKPLEGVSWYTRSTTDPDKVAEWFGEHPGCNFGVHPGDSHLVIDLDRKANVNGVEAFEKLCAEHGIHNFLTEIDTLIVRTANGGYHLYFKSPFPCANKNDLPVGIDARGAIGYVVGPGCEVTPEYSWSTGKYEVMDPSADIAPLPEWLTGYLRAPGRKDPRREEPLCDWNLPENIEQARAWLKHQDPAVEGAHGDDHTFETICFLRDFGVDEKECYRLLTEGGEESWNAGCKPSWDSGELMGKIENSFEYAANRPGIKSKVYLFERMKGVRPAGGYQLTDAQIEELHRPRCDGNTALKIEEHPDVPEAPEDEQDGEEREAFHAIRVVPADMIPNLEDLNAAVVDKGLNLFERGGSVVSLHRLTETEVKDGVRRPVGNYVISDVNPQVMQYMAMRAAAFYKWNQRKNGWILTECPKNLVEQYLKNHHVRDLRPLHGIAQSPTLRPDGSVLQENGYDQASAMFVELRGDFPPVPESPSRSDAEDALKALRNVVRGVMFSGKKSTSDTTPTAAESVWLSAVLTAVIRGAIPTAPLLAFSAPVKGSGKTLAADLVGIIATGNDVPAMSIPDSEEELRKTLFSSLLKGDGVMLLDNVKAGVPLRSDALNAILTKTSYEGRVLGASQILTVPVATTFMATGNNFAVDQDLQRRTLLCFIDPRMENPDQRRYDWDARVETRASRGELVAAALTIIRAYLTDDPDGAVRDELVPYGSFEDWDRLVRSPLVWLGMPDPTETRGLVAAGSEDDRLERALVDAWTDRFGEAWVRVKDVVAVCTTFSGNDDDELKEKNTALREVLEEICKNPKSTTSTELGHWLRNRYLRVISGRRIENRTTKRAPWWRMVDPNRDEDRG